MRRLCSHSLRLFRLVAILGLLTASLVGAQEYQQIEIDTYPASMPNSGGGFSQTNGLQFNGNAGLLGSALQLTSGAPYQYSSIFTTSRYSTFHLNSTFDFQITDPVADGFAFVVQDVSPKALGSAGGGVGYGLPPGSTQGRSIGDSVAFIFDLYNNPGPVSNTLRVVQNGSLTAIAGLSTSFDLAPLNLHSGHRFRMTISTDMFPPTPEGYTELGFKLLDLDDPALSISGEAPVYLAYAVGSARAYMGFTAATGSNSADIRILNWMLQTGDCITSACPTGPRFDNGFPSVLDGWDPQLDELKRNREAHIVGSALQLTNSSAYEANSAFFVPVDNTSGETVRGFSTDFDFTLGPASGSNLGGDGFALVLQDQSPEATGMPGGGLGYEGIAHSVALKFDMHNNLSETDNSTGVYVNGTAPMTPAFVIPKGVVDFHSGHTFHTRASYDGANLSFTITDLDRASSFKTTVPIDLYQTIGSSVAWPGFTAATGAESNTIQVLNWYWTVF